MSQRDSLLGQETGSGITDRLTSFRREWEAALFIP